MMELPPDTLREHTKSRLPSYRGVDLIKSGGPVSGIPVTHGHGSSNSSSGEFDDSTLPQQAFAKTTATATPTTATTTATTATTTAAPPGMLLRERLRPLAELQYRGAFWSQSNGKDWTVSAFLQAEKGGLNLRLARDSVTQDAIRRALEKLADVPLADLEAKSVTRALDSHDFDALLVEDPVDDLLTWLADSKGVRARWQSEPGRWEALRSRCKSQCGFDPEKEGELVGAELLGRQTKPAGKQAWKRPAAWRPEPGRPKGYKRKAHGRG